MGPRRLLVTLPIALAVAALGHNLRFGDEHAFGEEYHEWLSTVLLVGLPAVAWAFLAKAIASIPAYADGSVLADRLAALLPGRGRIAALTASIGACATGIYVFVEHLEADGDTSYTLALAIIAMLSLCASIAIRRVLAFVAAATLAFFKGLTQPRRTGGARRFARRTRPRPSLRIRWAAVRLGRAPPVPA